MESTSEKFALFLAIIIALAALLYFVILRKDSSISNEALMEADSLESESVESAEIGSRIFSDIEADSQSQSQATVPDTNPFDQNETNPFADIKNPFE